MAEIKHVQDPVVEYARETGWLARKIRYDNRNGSPDYWFMRGGVVVIMEFKDIDGETSMIQDREIAKLKRAGMNVFVVDSYENGCAILDRFRKK